MWPCRKSEQNLTNNVATYDVAAYHISQMTSKTKRTSLGSLEHRFWKNVIITLGVMRWLL